jgi:hypothetical protein
MCKFFLIFLFSYLLNTQPLFSREASFNMRVGTSINSQNTLGFYNNLKFPNKSGINLNLEYSERNLTSQLSLNFNDQNKLSFDNSNINFKKGIANLNIGKIDRIWSFSKKSSLILSSNSRPLETISINLESMFNTKWLPSTANWSLELINGSTKNSFNSKASMLTGSRLVIKPSEKFSFEFLQTAQWGNENQKFYSSNIDALLFGDTNIGKNSDINKMAGFGISYSIPFHKNTYRFYSQAIGEDEAGGLPSCYAWMAGLESTVPLIKFPTTITFEVVDTRASETENGNCGANTMYNNGVYDYINYDTVMGVPIDTESTSLELFGQSQVNENLSINYSAKFFSINKNNYSQHRLSSKNSLGTITSLGIHWEKNGFNFGGDIIYQDIILDKANISNGIILSLFTSVKF